jgi:hypothetical protein
MDTLDDYFTNAPQEQKLAELGGQAKQLQFETFLEDPLWQERAKAEIDFGKSAGLESFKFGMKQKAATGLQAELQGLNEEEAQGQADLKALQASPEYAALSVRAQRDPAAQQQLAAAEAKIQQQIANAQMRKRSMLQSYGLATGEAPSSLFAQAQEAYR